jgi:hypothetical protein
MLFNLTFRAYTQLKDRLESSSNLNRLFLEQKNGCRIEGGKDGRIKGYGGFLLGPGLPLVLDYIALDDRCRQPKADSGKLEAV